MSWRLQVWHNAATVEYDVSVIEKADGTNIAERATIDSVEIADVELALDDVFLGASSIFGLPSDDGDGNTSWRARLLFNWTPYIEGVIARRGGMVHDPVEGRWTLTLINDASQVFTDTLAAFPLRVGTEPNPALDLSSAQFLVRATDGPTRLYQAYWYDLQEVWDEVTSQFTDVTFPATTLFQYTTQYYDSLAALQTITRVAKIGISTLEEDLKNYDSANIRGAGAMPANLPAISALALFEALQIMEGWRVRVTYDAYPLRSVTVAIYSDTEAITSGGTTIDTLVEAENRPILDIEEPELNDLALRLRNNRIEESFWDEATDPLTVRHLLVPPPLAAAYSAETERLNAEGEPDNETVSEVPFYLPYVGDRYAQAGENPFSGTDPDYAEDWSVAGFFEVPPDRKGEGIIADFELEPGEVFYRMLQFRQVTAAGGFPATQDEYFSGAWAVQFLRKYLVARSESYVVDVSVDALDPTDYTVGNPGDGLTYLGLAWMVFERRFRPVLAQTVLGMRTLVGAAEDVSGGAEPEPALPMFPPLDLSTTCTCVNGEFSLSATWSAPSDGDPPTEYELEGMAFYEATWQPLTVTASTSFSWTAAGRADRGPYNVRVRSVDADGIPSPWAYDRVECETCGGAEIPICWQDVKGARAIYKMEGSGSVADGDEWPEHFGTYPGVIEWSEVGGAIEYDDRGLNLTDDTGGSSAAIEPEIDPDAYTDDVSFLCFFGPVDNTEDVDVQILNLWWASGAYNFLRFRESVGPNQLFWQVKEEVDPPTTYSVNLSINNALDPTTACFVAFVLDTVAKTYALYWIDDASGGWQKNTGSWSSAGPEAAPPDSVAPVPAQLFLPQGDGAEVGGHWAEFVARAISEDEMKWLYMCIREKLLLRDFDYFNTLPWVT